MTIQINSEQEESLHLSLSETKLLQMCNVQTLTSANRKKILSLLDKALPELVAAFLEESVEVQALLPKCNNPPGFKPVFVTLKTPRALWGEADEELPDGTVFYVDGYQFGDRLLEGVMFKCGLLDGGTSAVVYGPECDAYTASLNMKMWMQTCADQLGSMDYVAREVVKQEDIVDYTRRENLAERLAKRFGASIGDGAVRAVRLLPAVR